MIKKDVLLIFCFFVFYLKGKVEKSTCFHVDVIGGSDHIGYLQSNSLFMSNLTSDLSQMTFVRSGNKLTGYIKFHEKKSWYFVQKMVQVLFNTYAIDVHQVITLISDQQNWVRKFEYDYSQYVFYDFFFVH